MLKVGLWSKDSSTSPLSPLPSISSPTTPFCSKAANNSSIIGYFKHLMAYIVITFDKPIYQIWVSRLRHIGQQGSAQFFRNNSQSLHLLSICFMRHGEFSGNLCPWEGYRILYLYGLNFCKSCIRFNKISPANLFWVQHFVGSCHRVPQCHAGDWVLKLQTGHIPRVFK